MSEKNTTDQSTVPEQAKDRVGDIIRKERVTRRITVETIAKDLKLNARYIKALESNEYDGLPADPYVRVYLRSLAKYLSLNPEEILKKFYEERGLGSETYKKESAAKLQFSMSHKEESRSPMLVTAVVLILILAGFSFFANKKGWIPAPAPDNVSASPKTATTTPIASTVKTDSLVEDSSFAGVPIQVADTTEMKDSGATKPDPNKALQLHLEVTGDSVWIQVYSDGNSWKNVVYKNQTRDFNADDSFNIHVGNNSMVKYFVNGKELRVRGVGVVAFKYDKSLKPSIWTLSRWNTVFKNRL